MNPKDGVNQNSMNQSVPVPLPELPPSLTRRCRDCGLPFTTRFYGNGRCVQCSLVRLQAASAYARHESAWEERQRAAHAQLMATLAAAAARDARRTALLWQIGSWGVLAAGLLLALDWIGQ